MAELHPSKSASIFYIYANELSGECFGINQKKKIYIYIAFKYLRNGRKLNAYDNKRILKGDAKRNYYESNLEQLINCEKKPRLFASFLITQ